MRGTRRGVFLVVLLVVLVAAGCTGASKTVSFVDSSGLPTPTKPPPPPRPKTVSSARFEGRYKVTFVVISSRLPGSKNSHVTWTVKPHCRQGGECDVLVTSSGGWHARGAFVGGRYRWARTVPKAESCGSPGNISYYITSIFEYSVSMDKMALIQNQWVATSFDGTFLNRSTRGCGLSGPGVDERDALHGVLVR